MDHFNAPHDIWGVLDVHEELRMLKAAQFEHSERLSQHSERISRLERRRDDSRIRSLWSTPSPFPPLLSSGSFSQPEPIHPEPAEAFSNFEEQQQHSLLAGLHLDDVDVPRRGASRANSVRFDDSAIQNHWINDSQNPSDYFAHRTSNGGGGYPMTERSSSHKSDYKSDGRQSSMRSYGDNSSFFDGEIGAPFNPTTSFPASQMAPPGIIDFNAHRPAAPATGTRPAIIRCWLDSTPSYDSPLYAVVCTGSVKSLISLHLITRLGLQEQIRKGNVCEHKIELQIYLPDGTIQQPIRGNGPTQLPRIIVDFTVISSQQKNLKNKGIEIFLGSDVLLAHMGDVLFSQGRLMLSTDDGRKMSVPFAQPESQECFSDICTIHVGDRFLEGYLEQSLEKSTENPPQELTTAKCQRSKVEDPSSIGVDPAGPHVSLPSPKSARGRQESVINSSTVKTGIFSVDPDETPRKSRDRTNSIAHSGETEQEHGRPTRARKALFNFQDSHDRSEGEPSSNDEGSKYSQNIDRVGRSDGEGSHWGRSSAKSNGSPSGEGSKELSTAWKNVASGPPKENGTSVRTGTRSRASSRGMKVLRTSKSTCLTDSRATHQSESGSEAVASSPSTTAPPQAFNRSASTSLGSASIEKRAFVHSQQRERASSAEVTPSFSKVVAEPANTKAKSTNVVGGATAFKWMAPKASTASIVQ